MSQNLTDITLEVERIDEGESVVCGSQRWVLENSADDKWTCGAKTSSTATLALKLHEIGYTAGDVRKQVEATILRRRDKFRPASSAPAQPPPRENAAAKKTNSLKGRKLGPRGPKQTTPQRLLGEAQKAVAELQAKEARLKSQLAEVGDELRRLEPLIAVLEKAA